MRLIAANPASPVIFYVRVIAEQQNGLWRPGDTRVGDEFSLSELSDGNFSVRIQEANHTLEAKAKATDYTTKVNGDRIRHLFREASLAGLDFGAQLDAAKKTEKDLIKTDGITMVIGGTTVEVFSHFEGSDFKFICKDLEVVLPRSSRYNPELARLLALLEDLGVFKPCRYSFTQ